METMTKFRKTFIVVSLSFGPIFMVLGNPPADSPSLMSVIYAFGGFGGAASLSFALIYVLKTTDSIRAELEEIKKSVAESVAD